MLNSDRSDILAKAKSITLSLVGDMPIRVYLFGSSARGDYSYASDIDIALESNELVSRYLIQALHEAFEESSIPFKVDVLDMSIAEKWVVENILKEGVLWKG